MPIAKRSEAEHVPPGWYHCKILSFQDTNTKFGEGFKGRFLITTGEYEGKELSGVFPQTYSKQNKLGRLIRAVGYKIEEIPSLNLNKLVDEELDILVEDNQGRRGVFSKVVDFAPLGEGGSNEPEEA